MTAAAPGARSRWSGRLGTVLLVLSGLALATALLLPHLGLRLVTVETGSMAPSMPAGSVLLARHEPTADLRPGTVITFHAPTPGAPLVTHRVTAVDVHEGRTVVRTKGDANPGDDPWEAVLVDDRTWVVTAALPAVGTVLDAVRSPAVAPVLVWVLPAVFAVSTLRLIWRGPTAAGRRRGRWARRLAAGALVLALGGAVVLVPGRAAAAFTASVSRGHQVATADLRTPAALTVRNACLLTGQALDVGWTPVGSGATGYRIERRTGSSTTWTTLGTVAAPAISFRDTTVALLVTYTYRVSAVRGPWSSAPATTGSFAAGTC